MAHGAFLAEMASQTCWRRKNDKRGEKFSSGLIDHASWSVESIHVELEFGRWNTFDVLVATALYCFSNSAYGSFGTLWYGIQKVFLKIGCTVVLT